MSTRGSPDAHWSRLNVSGAAAPQWKHRGLTLAQALAASPDITNWGVLREPGTPKAVGARGKM